MASTARNLRFHRVEWLRPCPFSLATKASVLLEKRWPFGEREKKKKREKGKKKDGRELARIPLTIERREFAARSGSSPGKQRRNARVFTREFRGRCGRSGCLSGEVCEGVDKSMFRKISLVLDGSRRFMNSWKFTFASF